MRQRFILGPVLIIALVGLFRLDQWVDALTLPDAFKPILGDRSSPPPGAVIFVATAILCVLAARELAWMLIDKGLEASKRVLSCSAILGLTTISLVPAQLDGVRAVALVATAATLVLVGSLIYYARDRTVQGALAGAGGAVLAFVYLGLMAGLLIAIRREHAAWVLLYILLTTKSADIGAYLVGSAIGKHKLIPWLSPGKTWEGLIGGVVLASVIGALGAWMLGRSLDEPTPSIGAGIIAGCLFALVGQLGDLTASLFKRDAGIKDSGNALPGFGGVLDVMDSPLMVAPIAFWWLSWAT